MPYDTYVPCGMVSYALGLPTTSRGPCACRTDTTGAVVRPATPPLTVGHPVLVVMLDGIGVGVPVPVVFGGEPIVIGCMSVVVAPPLAYAYTTRLSPRSTSGRASVVWKTLVSGLGMVVPMICPPASRGPRKKSTWAIPEPMGLKATPVTIRLPETCAPGGGFPRSRTGQVEAPIPAG